MKRILIVAVNYNSYSELIDYLDSIEVSMSMVIDQCSMDVYVADNSSQKEVIDTAKYHNFNLHVVPLDNLGYFGGAFYVINNLIDPKRYTYVIISNVDILLEKMSVFEMLHINLSNDIAWIAPSIISKEEHRDKNPKVLFRYSKYKLKFLYYMYKYSFLHKMYVLTIYKRKKKRSIFSSMDIYAGHGSFMILTSNFFSFYSTLSYPVFLFCEELFIAELIYKVHMRVHYEPAVIVSDGEHVSTSKLNSSFYYKCNREAVNYILKTFYE